jgi:hypothetical protein
MSWPCSRSCVRCRSGVGLGAAGLDLGGAVKLGAGCDGAVELLILLAVPVGEGRAVCCLA